MKNYCNGKLIQVLKVNFEALAIAIDKIKNYSVFGMVTAIKGLAVEASGLSSFASIGAGCKIISDDVEVLAEIVSFEGDKAVMLTYGDTTGIALGARVELADFGSAVNPCKDWLGRVLNAFGDPIDDKGVLGKGLKSYPLKASAPDPHKRRRVEGKLDLGIRAINAFTSCCRGQRLGIFSGSGVGKSMMLAMMIRYAKTDIKVIGLIGERGREVQEFIQEYLGPEGLKKSVVIVSTSDEPALARRRAAYLCMAVSEYFRDQGMEVLTMVDSVTRFAQAQREIGLSIGEPPTTKGFTPSVFAELPRLLERAGPGTVTQGNITAFFSVLVEGDDTNEPIADTVRGILDGHLVLDRNIAMRGRYPAIDIIKSISRTMPMCNNDHENAIVNRAREYIAIYNDIADLVRIGAYKKGNDAKADAAIKYHEALEKFLSQNYKEHEPLEKTYDLLAKAIEFDNPAAVNQ